MLTGYNCLKYHCLRSWLEKTIEEGPAPAFPATVQGQKIAAANHALIVASLTAKVEALRSGGVT